MYRLEVLALQTLVKCLLAKEFARNPESVESIRSLYEASIQNFDLHGQDQSRNPDARDYMIQKGLEWISSAAHPHPNPPRPQDT
jgi:hypothetical protein